MASYTESSSTKHPTTGIITIRGGSRYDQLFDMHRVSGRVRRVLIELFTFFFIWFISTFSF